jgi:hypothetical protein
VSFKKLIAFLSHIWTDVEKEKIGHKDSNSDEQGEDIRLKEKNLVANTEESLLRTEFSLVKEATNKFK